LAPSSIYASFTASVDQSDLYTLRSLGECAEKVSSAAVAPTPESHHNAVQRRLIKEFAAELKGIAGLPIRAVRSAFRGGQMSLCSEGKGNSGDDSLSHSAQMLTGGLAIQAAVNCRVPILAARRQAS
jgi:hypothetical protein